MTDQTYEWEDIDDPSTWSDDPERPGVRAFIRRVVKMTVKKLDRLDERDGMFLVCSLLMSLAHRLQFEGDEGMSPSQRWSGLFNRITFREPRREDGSLKQITQRLLDHVEKELDLNERDQLEVVANMMMSHANNLEFEGSEGMNSVQKASWLFNHMAKKTAS